jgi:transcriptional regulator with XRE-family HTH domain
MSNLLLRTARQQKGWNQQQLADFAELSVSTVERAERGESIRVDSIQRLCACLHKTPEQLGLLNGEHEESVNDLQKSLTK